MTGLRWIALVALGWLVASSVAPVAADDWTRFRGPNGSGLSEATTIPVEWTEEDFNWRVELPGVGHSQPVIWKDRIFVTTADTDSGERRLVCHSTADGRELWHRKYPMNLHGKHLLNSFASSTPAVDDTHVYAAFSDKQKTLLVAVTHDGSESWSYDLGPLEENHGHGTSPVVVDDLVIIAHEHDGPSYLLALNRRDGSVAWKTARTGGLTSFSTPIVYDPADGDPQVIFNSNKHGIAGVDLATGKPLWNALAFDKRTCSSPVLAGDRILGTSGSGGGGNILAAVTLGGQGDVTSTHTAFRITRSSDVPYVPTPVAKDDLVFLWTEKGVVICIDDQGEIVWRQRVRGSCWASPICIGDKLYNVSTDGEVIVLSARREFQELARNPVLEGSHATLAVSDGVLYVRTFSHLLSIGGGK